VPWERVFLARHPLTANRLFRSGVMVWAIHAAVIQLVARMELMIGVGHLMATAGGIDQRPNVQQLLGELITYKRIFESLMRTSEIDCVKTAGGRYAPGELLHQRAFITLVSERIVAILEQIGTSGLIFLPQEKDFAAPELRRLIDLYYRGRATSAYDRTKLAKLAWELTGDGFGGRQQLYERLHSGDPNVIVGAVYQRYNKAEAIKMVEELLETRFAK
jgi:aromatic ring hydroxylase